MNAIAEIASALCYVAVACAVIDVLAPEGKLKKVFSIVVGAFILLTAITAVSGDFSLEDLKSGWDVPDQTEIEEQASDLKAVTEEQTLQMFSTSIEDYIRDVILSRLGVTPKKLSVSMDISETGSISMKCIEVTIDAADTEKALVITSELSREFGSDITISIKQGW